MKMFSTFSHAILILLITTSCSDDNDEHQKKVFNGDVSLTTQEEVNAFGDQNYTHIEGNLLIGDFESKCTVTDLKPLRSLRAVRLDFDIANVAGLENLEGLGNLEEVLNFSIWKCDNLKSMDGLESLKSVYIQINVADNPELTELFFGKLTHIKNLSISLPAITSLKGLEGIIKAQKILLTGNESLANINALQNLSSLDILDCHNNKVLTSLQGLSKITNFKSLYITRCKALTDLEGLNNLKHVEQTMEIGWNDGLISLSGFENLNSVNQMTIWYNPVLTNFCSLQSLTENSVLTINDNGFNPSKVEIMTGECSSD